MKKSSLHYQNDLTFYLKENSWIARLAASKLKASNMAVVIGSTIYLWNVSSADFLKNQQWVRHELCHVRQFRTYGLVPFLYKYLLESIKHGYQQNRFEMEARAAENGKSEKRET